MSKEFLTPSNYAMKIVDIKPLDFMMQSVVNYSAPFVHKGYSIVRFLELGGHTTIAICDECTNKDQLVFVTSLLTSKT